MKSLKVIGKVFASILILIILGVGILYAFQDRIIATVVSEVEKEYEVKMKYNDVNLSLIRDFPNLSVGIEELNITELKDSSQLTKMSELDISVGFYSLLSSSKPLQIHQFRLNNPLLLYEIRQDSTTNWDAFISTDETSSTDTASTGLNLSIDEYSINNGQLFYIDHTSSTTLEIININHRGAGNFSSEKFGLDTETSIDTIAYQSATGSYRTAYQLNLDALLEIDNKNSRYSFQDASLNINDLNISMNGVVSSLQNGYNIDISMNEVNSGIKQLLSLVPKEYLADYENIETDGELSIVGTLQGEYNAEKEVYPSVDIKFNVQDGYVKYPELAESLQEIQLSADIKKPEGPLDGITVNISPFSFRIGTNSPFQMRLAINNPISGPTIRGEANGTLDLNALGTAIPISPVESMSGNIETDVIFDLFYPSISAGKYESAKLNGTIGINNLKLKLEDSPQLSIPQSSATISPKKIEIKDLNLTYGRSDLNGDMNIINPLNYFSNEGPISINTSLNSKLLDLNQLTVVESSEELSSQEISSSSDSYQILNNLIVEAVVKCNKVIYGNYDLADMNADMRYEKNTLDIKALAIKYSGNNFQVDGKLENLIAYYTQDDATLMGNLNVKNNRFDLWKYMNSENETASENSENEPFTLPKSMNIAIEADINYLDYDKYALKNLNSTLQLQDQELIIKEGRAGLFNGSIDLSGKFSAKDNSAPSYDFNYNIDRIDFASAYANIVTFKKIAPVAEYIEGLFSTEMKISGKLDQNLYPDLNSIDASGIFKTLNADIKDFKPLDLISDKIGVNSLSTLDISDTKNFFNIQDGRFTVDPFQVMMKKIDATIEGSHSITGSSMDYTISAIIPREWLNQNSTTSKVNKGINWVEAQAKQYNLNVDAGDNLYVDILLSGSIKNPSVSLQLKDVGGKSIQEAAKEKAKEEAKRIQDSLKNVMRQEREKLEEEAQKRVDSLKRAAQNEAEKKVKEIITGKKDTSQNDVKDQVNKAKEDAKEKVENTKKKYKKWNPFK